MKNADRYRDWLLGDVLCENRPRLGRKISDLELQTRWFAEEFGREFITTGGEPAVVLDFGSWSRECGPTFSNASVSIAGRPPLRGGIEVTVDLGDWKRFADNPDYRDTRLHLFVAGDRVGTAISHSATTDTHRVPYVILDASRFEFSQSDGESAPDCGAPLASLPLERAVQLLEAAAQFRLCRKAARLQRHADPDEGLYQTVAESLGYRHNKLPFLLLAQRFPLSLLRRDNVKQIEPMLFGGAGFLNLTDLGSLEGDTRGYLRNIWNRWWPHRSESERLVLDSKLWIQSGVRPVNHPQRRLAALAEIVRHWSVLKTLVRQCEVAAIRSLFSGLTHEYWDSHYTLTSRRSATRMALVGETRVTEMLANVFFPAVVTTAPRLWNAYKELPALDSNQRVDAAAQRLFGPDPAIRRLLKQAVYQQGLLQLHENHCSACSSWAACSLREKLEHWPRAGV